VQRCLGDKLAGLQLFSAMAWAVLSSRPAISMYASRRGSNGIKWCCIDGASGASVGARSARRCCSCHGEFGIERLSLAVASSSARRIARRRVLMSNEVFLRHGLLPSGAVAAMEAISKARLLVPKGAMADSAVQLCN